MQYVLYDIPAIFPSIAHYSWPAVLQHAPCWIHYGTTVFPPYNKCMSLLISQTYRSYVHGCSWKRDSKACHFLFSLQLFDAEHRQVSWLGKKSFISHSRISLVLIFGRVVACNGTVWQKTFRKWMIVFLRSPITIKFKSSVLQVLRRVAHFSNFWIREPL